ncbi:hypothetical protein N2152v2_001880 [Parachlorella kessleri]
MVVGADKPEKDVRQRTLWDLQKVVKLETSAVCFASEAVLDHKKALLDPSTPKWLLLQTMRKLDCYRFQFQDLITSEIGCAVATLEAHPKLEVARLAHNLVKKWRGLVEGELFRRLPYDAALAATIQEEPPAPPQPSPEEAAAQQAADRQAQQELRRQQEADLLLTDSEEEGSGAASDDSDDWQPGGRSRRGSGKRKQKQKRA